MNYKMSWIKALGIVTLSLLVFFVAWHWHVYSEVQALKAPRIEQGVHKGALSCAQCHREIYDEWSTRSLHALATAGQSFNDYLGKFKASFLLNTFITDAACYSCHGEKTSTEGVNCEICHGTVIENVSIMETHKVKYKPGLKTLQEQEFCIKCHDMRSPLSLDGILTVPEEWRNSQAATKGETCQSCHMKKGVNGLSYHGFDTAHRDVTIYKDDVTIQNAKLQFPSFSLEIENRITGHALPPSGPTRIMVLEIIFLDIQGEGQHRVAETFSKKFELMPIVGVFPDRLIKNTQLQSGERRLLNFTLPTSLAGKVSKAVATLRFYGVSDEHQGDIQHAHWISKPILTEEFSL
jgi:hypothetical protein